MASQKQIGMLESSTFLQPSLLRMNLRLLAFFMVSGSMSLVQKKLQHFLRESLSSQTSLKREVLSDPSRILSLS